MVKNMRLLVIEDEKAISDFLKISLENEGFIVDFAEDGEKGSAMARGNDYDLIVLDNILPKKFGIQVCEEIRAAGQNVPILILSVKSATDTKVRLLNAGADDYLTKPFSLEELIARVRALLRRPTQTIGGLLKAGDLIMETNARRVFRGKNEIYLTKKEFALLEYLLRNLGTALSRGMIMEHVWDMEADPFSNTIESHIMSLRRKIDIKGKKSLVQTIPGIGYKIE